MHKEGKRLRSAEEHAALVGELRKAADAADVHVVINARTDLFLRNDGDDADRVERAVARLKLAARGRRRQPVSGGLSRPGNHEATNGRTATAGQCDRAPRPGRSRVVRSTGRRPDQFRTVLPACALSEGAGAARCLEFLSGVTPRASRQRWSSDGPVPRLR